MCHEAPFYTLGDEQGQAAEDLQDQVAENRCPGRQGDAGQPRGQAGATLACEVLHEPPGPEGGRDLGAAGSGGTCLDRCRVDAKGHCREAGRRWPGEAFGRLT